MRSWRLLLVVVAALVGVSACSDDDDGSSAGSATSSDTVAESQRDDFDLVVEAHDFEFDAAEYHVTSGDVTVAYLERGDVIHNLVIADGSGRPVRIEGGDQEGKLLVTTSADATGRVRLAPGRYEMICTIPGHAAAGMTATLTAT